jgi:hypothetical protein
MANVVQKKSLFDNKPFLFLLGFFGMLLFLIPLRLAVGKEFGFSFLVILIGGSTVIGLTTMIAIQRFRNIIKEEQKWIPADTPAIPTLSTEQLLLLPIAFVLGILVIFAMNSGIAIIVMGFFVAVSGHDIPIAQHNLMMLGLISLIGGLGSALHLKRYIICSLMEEQKAVETSVVHTPEAPAAGAIATQIFPVRNSNLVSFKDNLRLRLNLFLLLFALLLFGYVLSLLVGIAAPFAPIMLLNLMKAFLLSLVISTVIVGFRNKSTMQFLAEQEVNLYSLNKKQKRFQVVAFLVGAFCFYCLCLGLFLMQPGVLAGNFASPGVAEHIFFAVVALVGGYFFKLNHRKLMVAINYELHRREQIKAENF